MPKKKIDKIEESDSLDDRPHCCGKPMALRGHKAESGRVRYMCGGKTGCGRSTTNSPEAQDFNLGYDQDIVTRNVDTLRQKIDGGATRFFITSAQNNTRKHSSFFRSVQNYCKATNSILVITPSHYKNVSIYQRGDDYQKTWPKDLEQHMVDETIDLGGGVVLFADIRIKPTAMWPLQGLQPIGGESWAIYGHPQLSMEPVATTADLMPKRMYTTGSISVKNYSQSVEGAKAHLHHVNSGLIVEVDKANNRAYIRQANCDSTGVFYDLDYKYTPTGRVKSKSILSITTGDEHEIFMLDSVRAATYTDKKSLVKLLKPKYLIRHDVLDGYAGSHHHVKDDVLNFKKYHTGYDDYRVELDRVIAHLNSTTPRGVTNIMVESNHDCHLTQWLARVDPKKDHKNALLIHELKTLQYTHALANGKKSIFELYISPRLTCDHEFISSLKPWKLKRVDYSQHGHKGINGARGGARAFAMTATLKTIAHSHTARICKGVVQVGKSTGILDYEGGLSTHSQTHCLQYDNGKRTLIDIYPDATYRLNIKK